jgi:uncharacterized glyoxalase superfamily protein PhnB
MATNVKAIPDGFRTVTPHLALRNASEAIEFYKRAFAAEEIFRMPGPDGNSVMHAELSIGDSRIMLHDESPDLEGVKAPQTANATTVTLHLYVEDVDAAFQKAVDAGATPAMPPMDTFWGDRYGKVADPFGHHWAIATHKQDLTPEQIQKNAGEFFAQMACQH